MKKPLVTFALSFFAGIFLGTGALFFPWTIAAVLLTLSAAALWYLRRNGTAAAGTFLLILCGITSASAAAIYSTCLPHEHYAKRLALDGSLRTISGRIASPLERDPGRTAFLMEVADIDNMPMTGKVRVVFRTEQPGIGYGDRLSVQGKLFPVRGYRNPGGFDYPAYLGRQGVFAVLSVKNRSVPEVSSRGTGLFRTIQDWREEIRQSFLQGTSGNGSAVLLAMILGEEGGLTNELRDSFLAAGATHILSISGSHLGLVAIICFWLTRNLLFLLPERLYHRMTMRADPRKIAALFAIMPVTFYALLAGGQQATVRSMIMLLSGFAALLMDRDHDLSHALAFSALVALIPAPQAAFDISFQLSYLSVAAILFVVHLSGAVIPLSATWRERIRNDAIMLFSVSLAATIATAPLVLYYFNRISPWGILSNMIIVPFAGLLVVPLGLLSGVLSLFTGFLPFAWLNQAGADAFVGLTSFFAGLPGSTLALPAPDAFAAIAYAVLICSGAALLRSWLLARTRPLEHSRRHSRAALLGVCLSGAVLAANLALPPLFGGTDRITFLDVGQGDCALAETADGRHILIDGGGALDGRFDVGQKVVAPFLWNKGVRTIDLVVLSHPHPDHMNGLSSVLRTFSVREVWTSGSDLDLEGYAEFRKAAEEQGTTLRRVQAGERTALGTAILEVLHPRPDFGREAGHQAYAAENNRSLVLRLTMSNRRILFPGDIHREAERDLAASGDALASDLIKVPHHGSKTSSTSAFLDSVRPSVAVISVAAGNPYRQPSDEVVERFLLSGAQVYRTDRDGAVIVAIREGGMVVTAWTSLLLKPVTGTAPPAWWNGEHRNWERILLRRAAI